MLESLLTVAAAFTVSFAFVMFFYLVRKKRTGPYDLIDLQKEIRERRERGDG